MLDGDAERRLEALEESNDKRGERMGELEKTVTLNDYRVKVMEKCTEEIKKSLQSLQIKVAVIVAAISGGFKLWDVLK